MLPSDLLMYRQSGETVIPKKIELDSSYLDIVTELIECFGHHQGKTQGELDQSLLEFEGDRPDFRVIRGMVHLLKTAFCTFEVVSPLEPSLLRQKVFTKAADLVPCPQSTQQTLAELAIAFSQELQREVLPAEIQQGLYADLPDHRILTQFDRPDPLAVIHRYNLSQVQGIFYRSTQIVINAHRNVPGQYKLLFRYLKLFQLMAYIEGDADCGFTITIDGPASLFKSSTRYGLAIAKLIPALLHVTKWSLSAGLQTQDFYTGKPKAGQFQLDSDCGLISHYPPDKPYDSMLEAAFAERWQKLKTDWVLEREVDLIAIPGSVMIPDFRLVHPNGKIYLLEIVGYWRPEYLQKKFAQVRKANCDYLILAISERLNLEKAQVDVKNLPAKVVWFKDKLDPKTILAALESSV